MYTQLNFSASDILGVQTMGARVSPGVDLDGQLNNVFGLKAFRPWQREAIEALLNGQRQVLVVAPTGGGKSLTYQLPATLLKRPTVVISPLIALMEDQVAWLGRSRYRRDLSRLDAKS